MIWVNKSRILLDLPIFWTGAIVRMYQIALFWWSYKYAVKSSLVQLLCEKYKGVDKLYEFMHCVAVYVNVFMYGCGYIIVHVFTHFLTLSFSLSWLHNKRNAGRFSWWYSCCCCSFFLHGNLFTARESCREVSTFRIMHCRIEYRINFYIRLCAMQCDFEMQFTHTEHNELKVLNEKWLWCGKRPFSIYIKVFLTQITLWFLLCLIAYFYVECSTYSLL